MGELEADCLLDRRSQTVHQAGNGFGPIGVGRWAPTAIDSPGDEGEYNQGANHGIIRYSPYQRMMG